MPLVLKHAASNSSHCLINVLKIKLIWHDLLSDLPNHWLRSLSCPKPSNATYIKLIDKLL